jgi:CheY-like chemotaxis protein
VLALRDKEVVGVFIVRFFVHRFVRTALELKAGWCTEDRHGPKGLSRGGLGRPLVLDLELPDGNRLDLIRDVQGLVGRAIIVLSARSDRDRQDRRAGRRGRYLTKPFGVGESCSARAKTNLRRPRAASRWASDPVFRLAGRVDRTALVPPRGRSAPHADRTTVCSAC